MGYIERRSYKAAAGILIVKEGHDAQVGFKSRSKDIKRCI
jgi:hypothetical protein